MHTLTLLSSNQIKNLFFLTFLFTLVGFAGCAQQTGSETLRNLSAGEVKKLLRQNPELVIIDVRTPQEFNQGHLQGARNLDFYAPDFTARLSALDTAKTYLLYCASGNRSGKAARQMESENFSTIYNATAGFQELKSAGLAVK